MGIKQNTTINQTHQTQNSTTMSLNSLTSLSYTKSKPHLKAESITNETADTNTSLDAELMPPTTVTKTENQTEEKTLIFDKNGKHRGYQYTLETPNSRYTEYRYKDVVDSKRRSLANELYYTSRPYTSSTDGRYCVKSNCGIYDTMLNTISENPEYDTSMKSPVIIRSCQEFSISPRVSRVRYYAPRTYSSSSRYYSYSTTPKKSVKFLETPKYTSILKNTRTTNVVESVNDALSRSSHHSLMYDFKRTHENNLRKLKTQIDELKQINDKLRESNLLRVSNATVMWHATM